MTEAADAKPPHARRGEAVAPVRPRSRAFRIIAGEAGDWNDVGDDELLLVCPWLSGLDPQTGLWLATLPIHDCNGFIDGDWTLDAPPGLRERCHVGIFALDRLRSERQIFGPLGDKGVTRLINLPSIGFFDGTTAETFGRFAFTLDNEIAFLAQARGAGFVTALCAHARYELAPERTAPFDFVMRHGGPGEPLFVEAP